MTASTRPGMGALLFAGGASFRVWAPFATNVCVAGWFNGWSMTANPLTHEENGYWSTDVSGAKLDDQYKFVLTESFQQQTYLEERSLRPRHDQLGRQQHHC